MLRIKYLTMPTVLFFERPSSDLYSFATRLPRSHFITSLRDYLGPILSHTYFHTKVIEARSEIYQSIDFHPFGAKITYFSSHWMKKLNSEVLIIIETNSHTYWSFCIISSKIEQM